MTNIILTERERRYIECDVPMLTAAKAAGRLILAVFASFVQAIFAPSTAAGSADDRLMHTAREMRYTRYKRSVLHKLDGTLTKRDIKTLDKINKTEFILEADAFITKVYDEYMKTHNEEGYYDSKRNS